MLLEIITNALKKVLLIDDKICNRSIIFAAVALKLTCGTCNFVVMILTRTGLHNTCNMLRLEFHWIIFEV